MSRCKRYAASLILLATLIGGGAAAGRPSAPAAVGREVVLGSKHREAVRPNGPLGRWYTWGGQRTLCRWS